MPCLEQIASISLYLMKNIYMPIPTGMAEKNSWKMSDRLVPSHMVYFSTLISAENIWQYRKNKKDAGQFVPSYTAFIIKAAALTLKKHPTANRCAVRARSSQLAG